ncbi:twitch domain-containing radical SAM protein [bacterium]|nr:twitch domain-containing radical SAM protein [bacterium]
MGLFGESDDLKKLNSAVCPLPWISASFNTDASFRVCCNTSHGGLITSQGKKLYLAEVNSLNEIKNSETVVSLKNDMLAGIRSDFCKSCYDVEDSGGMSIRQYYLKKYKNFSSELNKNSHLNVGIKFLDFSLSNNCNLKCRMCTPGASYLLSEDFKKAGFNFDSEYSEKAHVGWKYEGLIEELIKTNSDSLEDILFTGGEPLTNQIHLKVLSQLVAIDVAKKINLTYHSNLMVLPKPIIELWKNFKSVEVHLSLEGHEQYNDYIRHNSRWNKILENLDTLLSHKKAINLWFEIHTVFQAYNVLVIPKFLNYLQRFNPKIPVVPHFIWIDNPSFLSVNSLSLDLKKQAVAEIERFIEDNRAFYQNSKYYEFNLEKIEILKSCLKRIVFEDFKQEQLQFVSYTRKLDSMRNQNVLDVFPELSEVFI